MQSPPVAQSALSSANTNMGHGDVVVVAAEGLGQAIRCICGHWICASGVSQTSQNTRNIGAIWPAASGRWELMLAQGNSWGRGSAQLASSYSRRRGSLPRKSKAALHPLRDGSQIALRRRNIKRHPFHASIEQAIISPYRGRKFGSTSLASAHHQRHAAPSSAADHQTLHPPHTTPAEWRIDSSRILFAATDVRFVELQTPATASAATVRSTIPETAPAQGLQERNRCRPPDITGHERP